MKQVVTKLLANPYLLNFLGFYRSAELNLSSVAVAYYMLLSLFPVIMIIANVLPFLHLDSQEFLGILRTNLPKQFYLTVSDVIEQVLSQPNTGLLSLAVITGFWTLSKALSALQTAMNKAYEVYAHRDFIVSQFFSIVASFGLMIFLSLSVLLALFGQISIDKLHEWVQFDNHIYQLLRTMRLPAVALFSFLALCLLYFILPNVKLRRLRNVFPGSVFATLVLVFLPNLVGKYVTHTISQFADLKIISSLVLFALMLWFIFIAKVLILGAVFNAVYFKTHIGSIETRKGDLIEIIKGMRE